MGPIHWIHGWGIAYGIYPWGSALVMGKFDGETFLGGLLIFFLGGGRESARAQSAGSVAGRHTLSNIPILFYIIYCAVEFLLQHVFRPSRRGSSILVCHGQTRALLGLQQPVDLVHTLKTVKGLLLVPPRTPRSSGYDVYVYVVFVVICYMSLTCICLLYVVI
jgi:hypothetical protein